MLQTTLNERCESWNENVSVDVPNRLVLNVALAGQSSRNGYRYTEESLLAALPLYESKPVFLDHATNRQRPQERSTRDLVGSITSPRFVSGRVRGDIQVLDTESGHTFLKLVEAQSPGVGMSHVVLAERSADGREVHRIADVVSVDVVVNPATTTTFRESTCLQDSSAVLDGVAAASSGSSADGELSELRQQRDRLQSQVGSLQQEVRELKNRESVRELLAGSGLPTDAISECFQRQLLNAATTDERQQLLQDRLSLTGISRRTALRPASQPRAFEDRRSQVDEEFLRVLKRRGM